MTRGPIARVRRHSIGEPPCGLTEPEGDKARPTPGGDVTCRNCGEAPVDLPLESGESRRRPSLACLHGVTVPLSRSCCEAWAGTRPSPRCGTLLPRLTPPGRGRGPGPESRSGACVLQRPGSRLRRPSGGLVILRVAGASVNSGAPAVPVTSMPAVTSRPSSPRRARAPSGGDRPGA
jgi:hypothetical protein